jgi:arsenic resistance protein ArsH
VVLAAAAQRHALGIMKTQIDWTPLASVAQRPTQSETLALMQVFGGSQSFNAANQMRVLGRSMLMLMLIRMLTIPNQSSIAKAFQEFDERDRITPSACLDRVVDVLEQLVKFTWLTRDMSPYRVDRNSERKETAKALMKRANHAGL